MFLFLSLFLSTCLSWSSENPASVSPALQMLQKEKGFTRRFSPELSLVTSSFQGDINYEQSQKFGYGVGALIEFGSTQATFETGFLYRQLGSRGKFENLSINYDIGYFAIPLGVKYELTPINPWFVKASILPSYAFSKHLNLSDGQVSETYHLKTRDYDFQAVVSVGKRWIQDQDSSFIVSLQYLRGLVSVSENYEIYNSAFLFSAAYAFEQ
ncbi:MAG: outer membrane beta-barrel protein [Bdellovibrionales bacterium]